MYLKSLTLKGFKSFADRTVLKFEPGVAAIVGPNGSGKSNISDAVLWVLGERNAKNLRGQSMEDVIFAGSSARKPVSVAEVELLLDNSDGTLPVDFAEVSIGRRMYRSGESEYLINGNVVRRMDVLDILHDSGLGTGTNSIISQGNLDSVLSSRPEDRRALIEEAAGILKHKERKAKSERKLAQMDAHLDRVHDITAEVERQLKPLERKARKARTYEALSAEMKDLKLRLAVDDLRGLQKRWDDTLAQEQALNSEQQQVKEELEAAEKVLDELQKTLHERGSKELELNERYRRAQASFERLNSTAMVVREKRSHLHSETERLTRSMEESRLRRSAAEKELTEAQEAARKAQTEYSRAEEALAKLEANHKEQTGQRNSLRKKVDALMSEQRGLIHRQETIQATQEALRENLSEKRARAQVIDAQVADAQKRLETAQAQAQELQRTFDELSRELENLQTQEASARSILNSLVVKRDQGRKHLDEAREAYTHASAERAALEELERASESANPLLAQVLESRSTLAPTAQVLSHIFKAPAKLDGLVEMLLGDDVYALVAPTSTEAVLVSQQALESKAYGSARIVALDSQKEKRDRQESGREDIQATHLSQSKVQSALSSQGMTQNISLENGNSGKTAPYRLIDELDIDPAYCTLMETLLGDVWVVSSLDAALKEQQNNSGDCSRRFVSLEGAVVCPDGKIYLARKSEEDQKNSVLSRRRDLERARQQESEFKKTYERIQAENKETEEELRHAQTESLKLSEALANSRGRCESAERDALQSAQNVADLEEELAKLVREQKANNDFLAKAQPDSDELEKELSEVVAKLDLNKDEVEQVERSLSPLRRSIVAISEKLSDARLEVARLSERLAYAQRMEQTRRQEISSSAREDETSLRRSVIARGAAQRADALLATLASLSDAASLVSIRLEQESASEQSASQELHDNIAKATQTSREVRQRFEGCNAKLSEVRIEKGRLEIQVDAGIKAIVEDCDTSLEAALTLEALQDRNQVEQQCASLERRIKNMGTINPDAAQEYEEVNKRFQYLSAQLEDMRLARKSLARIVSVIDERMRNDFVTTFEQVNTNFSEIFSTLFPGGHAHLSLVDPDDLEHTGVDVNAQPVGKRVKKMSLLSGGEKSMTAMALLFAVYRIRQTPFYILDEVEAALDDTNLRRLIAYLEVIRDQTQFIMITHQRRTMESADILYGVSMQADGITKVVSQKIDNARRKEG